MRSGAIKYVAETMGVLAVCSIVFSAIAVLCLSDDLVAERLEKGGKRSALCLLDAWAAILPIRIAKEDLGDYREDIERRADAGQRWLLWLRVITALVWTGINAVGFVSKNLLGKEVESPPDKQPSK